MKMGSKNATIKKRILYCESNTDGTVGGSFFSLLYLVEGIDKAYFDPVVIFHSDNSLVPTYRKSGIDTRIQRKPTPYGFAQRISKYGLAGNVLGKTLSPIQKMLNFSRFLINPVFRKYYYLKKNKIDIVHLNNSIIRNNDWMIAAFWARIPCITHERGINAHYPKLARWIAQRLDAIVCISNAVADNLKQKGVPENNIRIIYNGLDPEIVKVTRQSLELRDEYGIQHDAPIIGIIGNIKQWKGQKSVVLATALVKKQFKEIRCFIVGDTADADIDYKYELDELIRKHGLEENIIFTGHQSNVADYMNLMDVVIHASVLPEPFGRVLIEAMAMKKPLIGARAGAVPEIIINNKTGLTFQPDNANNLASCIISLLKDPDLARNMGAEGYARLIDDFSIQSNVQKTTAIYDSILCGPAH